MQRIFIVLVGFLAAVNAQGALVPLKIDKIRSHLEIHVNVTLESFDIKVADYEPDIKFDSKDRSVAEATLRFKFIDLKTGQADRDQQILDWENAAKYPDGAFVLGNIQSIGDTGFQATGKLTFHGVTREVSFPVAIRSDHSLFLIDGRSSLDTRDFGLPVIRKFGIFSVNPIVAVTFHLQGSL